MSSVDYKVLVVVDLQNCFIQGGSLGSPEIKDLKKYIELVEGIDKKITDNNYDLVVFSKDSHPLNHSSLSDNVSPPHGIYTYHCRDSENNCKKGDYSGASTYMSKEAKNKLKDVLFSSYVIYNSKIPEGFIKLRELGEKELNKLKEEFYNKKKTYTEIDYNFYNPILNEFFSQIIENELIFINSHSLTKCKEIEDVLKSN